MKYIRGYFAIKILNHLPDSVALAFALLPHSTANVRALYIVYLHFVQGVHLFEEMNCSIEDIM